MASAMAVPLTGLPLAEDAVQDHDAVQHLPASRRTFAIRMPELRLTPRGQKPWGCIGQVIRELNAPRPLCGTPLPPRVVRRLFIFRSRRCRQTWRYPMTFPFKPGDSPFQAIADDGSPPAFMPTSCAPEYACAAKQFPTSTR